MRRRTPGYAPRDLSPILPIYKPVDAKFTFSYWMGFVSVVLLLLAAFLATQVVYLVSVKPIPKQMSPIHFTSGNSILDKLAAAERIRLASWKHSEDKTIVMVLRNYMDFEVEVYWMNSQGQEVFIDELPSSDFQLHDTFQGHIFVLREPTSRESIHQVLHVDTGPDFDFSTPLELYVAPRTSGFQRDSTPIYPSSPSLSSESAQYIQVDGMQVIHAKDSLRDIHYSEFKQFARHVNVFTDSKRLFHLVKSIGSLISIPVFKSLYHTNVEDVEIVSYSGREVNYESTVDFKVFDGILSSNHSLDVAYGNNRFATAIVPIFSSSTPQSLNICLGEGDDSIELKPSDIMIVYNFLPNGDLNPHSKFTPCFPSTSSDVIDVAYIRFWDTFLTLYNPYHID